MADQEMRRPPGGTLKCRAGKRGIDIHKGPFSNKRPSKERTPKRFPPKNKKAFAPH